MIIQTKLFLRTSSRGFIKPLDLCRFKSSSKKKSNKSDAGKSKRFSDTLNLPRTSFPLSIKNGAAAEREKVIQMSPGFQSVYEWQQKQDREKRFVLHDGPPYANGKTHVGHVVNKVLKDVTNRYKVLKGYNVHFVPGWDCHGMPIEVKALVDSTGQYQQLSAMEIRKKAKAFAEKVLEEQKKSFLSWGIMGDWDNVYKTLSPEYEASQLKLFFDIYEKGYVYRDYMPVYWSPSSQTALAEAELEYNPTHVSKSAYVTFPLISHNFSSTLGSHQVSAVVWTTTPWTLPFNKALCYNPKLSYAFVKDPHSSNVYLCESAFVEKLGCQLNSSDLNVMLTIKGDKLESAVYSHPLSHGQFPFVASSHVTTGKGTGLVHTAPAHGHDDFKVASVHHLSKECHVDGQGRYVSGVDESLLGKTVGQDADDAVLAALGSHVLCTENYTHSYPYDWRTKQPVIIRASRQWFINTQALSPLAVESLQQVKITPEQSERGMLTELLSRPYWCISRQRTWGVPIPVFYNKSTQEPLINRDIVDHVRNLMLEQGSDCWWKLPIEELLPDNLLSKISAGKSSDYERGSDILDIWFDSGASWASVLKEVKDQQADMYMEGIDQFKGWFQTSLLTSVAVRGKAPYRHIVTHGFATDETGMKMSKSLGNVIDPEVVIWGGKNQQKEPSYGVDVLRWWVAHSHHHQNINVGPSLLKQFSEDVFKLRKCLRYMLGNLSDFDPSEDVVPYTKLTAVDKYMLYILSSTMKQIDKSYESIGYNKVIQNLEKFIYSDLSSFYFTNTKDRCYCSAPKDEGRRSSQTIQYHMTKCLLSAIGPVVPHLAEEVHQHLPGWNEEDQDTNSVFKLGWNSPDPAWDNPAAAHSLMPVFDMRRAIVSKIGLESPVEFDVFIHSSPLLHSLLKILQPQQVSLTSSLCEVLQTSRVHVLDKPPQIIPEDDTMIIKGSSQVWDYPANSTVEVDFNILLAPAQLNICERCRRYSSERIGKPCSRCLGAMAQEWAT